MEQDDPLYLHAFNLFKLLGPGKLLKLAGAFESFKSAFEAEETELSKVLGIQPEAFADFRAFRQNLSLAAEAKKLEDHQIRLLSFKDPDYPKLLLEISDPPALLYYRGTMRAADEMCIAVVGTRKITNYGRIVVPLLIEPLVRTGVTIVSGLAFGVDTAAQQIAINLKRRSIAVLGGGLDEKSLYPKPHALAAEQVVDCGGALLSEYPPGTPPLKHHFVARNRIISGLSTATIVVECGLDSGSLITAKLALDQNREVFSVPGPIYSEQSQGTNNLIKMGAKPLTEASEILEELNILNLPEQLETREIFGDSPTENSLLALLSLEPINVNELIKQSELEAAEVGSALTLLEMKGKIRNLGGQQYILSR